MSLLAMISAHWQQNLSYATVSLSLARPRERELITDDICAYATNIQTCNGECLTGNASQR